MSAWRLCQLITAGGLAHTSQAMSKMKFTLNRAELSYLLLKRWKGDVCLVLLPADYSRRVGPHVTGYVQNKNLRCIERKFAYLLLKHWKGDVCLMLLLADHNRRVGPHVTG
jgi:hypothetical protein